MVRHTSALVLLTALAAAEDITTQIWMTRPPVTYAESLQYSGSVVNVEEDRTTIVLTGSVIGPESEQSSLDSYYNLVFNTQATRFTFSGTTAFEFKSAWANGMYVNIDRCQDYTFPQNAPVTCTNYIQSAWEETLCAALEEDRNLVPEQVTRTTVDDVGSTWTISGPNPAWTEDCVEGSDYIGSPGSGIGFSRFAAWPIVITAGGEKLAAQTGAAPTQTDASKTDELSSAVDSVVSSTVDSAVSSVVSGSEEISSTVTSEASSQSTATGVPSSITAPGNFTASGTGNPPVQTISSGRRNTPVFALVVGMFMVLVFAS